MAKNHWDRRFSSEEYAYGKEANQFIKAKGPLLSKGKTLALAEGEGRNAVYLATLGQDVTTWDFSEEGLKKTKQLAEEKGVSVETRFTDLSEAPWQNETWDNVIMVFGHFETDLRRDVLKHIEQSVKKGGSFLCEVYSKEQLDYKTGGPRQEDMLYAPEELLTTFSGWDMKHFFMGEVDRQEGELHQGLSHVIQFYGVKR
ncbi:MAG TPA: class I SAM-dependent methyltransferase [Candidatus Avamphibacillus sp.]|nr:class I SAM-dependent methyltransferase [Candidatus Avamphibacillus sp.]